MHHSISVKIHNNEICSLHREQSEGRLQTDVKWTRCSDCRNDVAEIQAVLAERARRRRERGGV